MGTLQTIAEKLELSPATVSRALRNIDGVNFKTRQRVLRAAKDLNYNKNKSSTVGLALILPGTSINDVHELAQRYMLAVSDAVSKKGWSMFPVVVDSNKRKCLESVNNWPMPLKAPHLNSCIVIDPLPLNARLTLHRHFNGNMVMLSRHDIEHGISGIRSLDYDGGKLAVRKVLDAGHTRIGWIGSIGSADVSHERKAGVISKLQQRNLDITCEAWFDERQPLTDDEFANIMKQHLPASRKDWPTAWISSTDWLGAKAIVFFKSQGLSIPQDIALVAFDDTKLAEIVAGCVISSIVMPFEKMAHGGVELLEKLICQREDSPVIWSYPFTFRQGQTL